MTVEVPIEVLTTAISRVRTDSSLPRILLLCRTHAQVLSWRRQIAAIGGLAGVEVITLRGLAVTAMPLSAPATGGDELPRPDTALTRRLGPEGDRPGLEAHLASLVSRYRLEKAAAGREAQGSVRLAPLAELAAYDWGQDEQELAIGWLIDSLEARKDEKRKGPDATRLYDQVLCVGYPHGVPWEAEYAARWAGLASSVVPSPACLWEQRALALLQAEPLFAEPGEDAPSIPAISVPDAPAEARHAIKRLLELDEAAQKRALILVPDEPTAARVRAAGIRNGVALAGAEHGGLGGHALAPVLRAALGWFGPESRGDPTVRASHLAAVLRSPVVGNRLPFKDGKKLAKEIRETWTATGSDCPFAEGIETRLSSRDVGNALRDARIVEAPLSVWIARLEELARAPRPDGGDEQAMGEWRRTRRLALLLGARLCRLRTCILAEEIEIEPGADTAPDDQDTVGHEIDEAIGLPGLPVVGTIGALRRFLLDCGLRIHNDAFGRALLSALRDESDRPAIARNLARVLRGTTTSDEISDGVTVLTYEDYDGRPTSLVLLLGCHDKGLAAAPSPDPFLDEPGLAALGLLGGRRAVVFRLLQALRAASAAEEKLAIVTARDSAGRAVVPPIQLHLEYGDREPTEDSYGLDCEIPESENRATLVRRPDDNQEDEAFGPGDFPNPPPSDDFEIRLLATQANAEWYRSGRARGQHLEPEAEPPEGEEPPPRTLARVIEAASPLSPAWLERYLGVVGDLGIPWDRTGDNEIRAWSLSRHFDPLCNCLYRFFAQNVLRIDEEEPVSDELDPAEVGSAVHLALERANPWDGEAIDWRPAGDEEAVFAARAAAHRLLCGLSETTFAGAVEALGHADASVRQSMDGLLGRWHRHWGRRVPARDREKWLGYVAKRIQGVEIDLPARARRVVDNEIRSQEAYEDLVLTMLEALEGWGVNEDNKISSIKKWIVATVRAIADGSEPSQLSDQDLCQPHDKAKLPHSKPEVAGPVRELIQDLDFIGKLRLLAAPVQGLDETAEVLCGRSLAVLSELPFGSLAAEAGLAEAGTLVSAALQVGDGELPLRGIIDRVMLVETSTGPVLQIMDYKTGGAPPKRKLYEGIATLKLPQLPLYALALRSALARGEAVRIPAGTPIRALGYDYVRKSALYDDYLLTEREIDTLREHIATLVGHARAGRFWPVPLEDSEEGKESWGWPRGRVTLREASRFGGLPALPELAEEGDEVDEGDSDDEGGEA